MNTEEIRAFQKRQPFEPFEIVLVDDRIFPVPHPDFILIPPGRKNSWVYVTDEEGHVEHINTLVISTVRNRKSRGKSNGKGRKAG